LRKITTLIVVFIMFTFLTIIRPANAEWVTLDYGVYWNSACTQEVTEVDWGMCYPNSWKTKTIYLRNEGGCFESFTIQISNPQPSDLFHKNSIRFYWNLLSQAKYETRGEPSGMLQPIAQVNEVLTVRICIFVHPYVSDIYDFGFDINVYSSMACDVTGCPPDYLPDGVVNGRDYSLVGLMFGTQYVPFIKEDINRDGVVNAYDVQAVSFFNMPQYVSGSRYIEEDINQDHYIDTDDLALVSNKFGHSYDEGYIPCDITHDGKVDGREYSMVGLDFGKHLVE